MTKIDQGNDTIWLLRGALTMSVFKLSDENLEQLCSAVDEIVDNEKSRREAFDDLLSQSCVNDCKCGKKK